MATRYYILNHTERQVWNRNATPMGGGWVEDDSGEYAADDYAYPSAEAAAKVSPGLIKRHPGEMIIVVDRRTLFMHLGISEPEPAPPPAPKPPRRRGPKLKPIAVPLDLAPVLF